MLVIWNARTGVPVRTIFEPHPGGCIDLDISPDAMYAPAYSVIGLAAYARFEKNVFPTVLFGLDHNLSLVGP